MPSSMACATTPVLPGEDPDAFNARVERWTADLGPRDDVERFLVQRAVQLSWQLERADRAVAARPADAGPDFPDRVTATADEVAALGRRLFWDRRGPTGMYPDLEGTVGMIQRISFSGRIDDPNDPARLVNRLEATALGCAWMLDRWGELRQTLEDGLLWQPPDRLRAIRLMGRQPMDALEDRRVLHVYLACAAMGPPGTAEFQDLATELRVDQRQRFLDRINGRLVADLRPADAEEGRAALLGLIAEEEARLEEVLTTHLERGAAAGEGPLVRCRRGGGAAPSLSGDVRPGAAARPGGVAQAPPGRRQGGHRAAAAGPGGERGARGPGASDRGAAGAPGSAAGSRRGERSQRPGRRRDDRDEGRAATHCGGGDARGGATRRSGGGGAQGPPAGVCPDPGPPAPTAAIARAGRHQRSRRCQTGGIGVVSSGERRRTKPILTTEAMGIAAVERRSPLSGSRRG